MQPDETENAVLDRRMDDICEALKEAIDREVETLRREGFPVYVSDNGKVVDLQTAKHQ